jgi:hypothetical protein
LGKFKRIITRSHFRDQMLPWAESHRVELHKLAEYPDSTEELELSCRPDYARELDAWFTTCEYDNGQDAELRVNGEIPSPQLAKLLNLRWAGHRLTFTGQGTREPVFRNMEHGDHWAAMIRADLLAKALSRSSRTLVWRVYGWKWIASHSVDDSESREYWTAYSLSDEGAVECLGGGTWIMQPNAIQEQLPWPAEPRSRKVR